jgi:uncharacterized membrane protein YfcA
MNCLRPRLRACNALAMPEGALLYVVWLLCGLLGFSLGAFGGGGTLLAVPLLIYVAGFAAQDAIGLSLLIVGLTSLVASLMYWRAKLVDLRAVALLGLAGALGALGGAQVTSLFSDRTLSLLFAGLMVVVSVWMLMRKDATETQTYNPSSTSPWLLLIVGACIGFLTGFLGVGGGFLIVPALAIWVHLPMQRAVGTSLAIVTINSSLGYVAHMQELTVSPWSAASLAVPAVIGALIGLKLANRWPACKVRYGFASLSIVVATGMIIAEVM